MSFQKKNPATAVLLLLLLLTFAFCLVSTVKVQAGTCVKHIFSCCPMIEFSVEEKAISYYENTTCTEIAKFAASPDNINPECLSAHIVFVCRKRIGHCQSPTNTMVYRACNDVCYRRYTKCVPKQTYLQTTCNIFPFVPCYSTSTDALVDRIAKEFQWLMK